MAKSWKKAEGQTGDAWKPAKVGDSITGELLEVRTVNTTYGEKEIADFLCDGNRRAQVWLSPTALHSKWNQLMPQPGEEIRITYLGKVINKAGTQEYANYELEVMRDEDQGSPPTAADDNVPF